MRDAAAAVLLIETAMPCDRRRVQELTDIAIRVSGIALLFVGTSYAQPTGLVAILDRSDRSMRWREPPDSFRILAIVPTYNEEDIIESTIRDTIPQGLEVYLIDNWSTDRTYSLARRFEGRGLVGLERWAVGELRV
jgi:cellulose synthase/poly-beta-1,6-N-acetylglucosamine synthase-like glycosyltransferase